MLPSQHMDNETWFMCDLKTGLLKLKDMINYNGKVSQESQRQALLSCIGIDISRRTVLFENGARGAINATYLVKIEK